MVKDLLYKSFDNFMTGLKTNLYNFLKRDSFFSDSKFPYDKNTYHARDQIRAEKWATVLKSGRENSLTLKPLAPVYP